MCTENFRGLDNEYDEYSTIVTTGVEAITEKPDKVLKLPEIDSCCGHNGFTATPFDSELRTCCEDSVVRTWGDEGTDPCVDDFEIDIEF